MGCGEGGSRATTHGLSFKDTSSASGLPFGPRSHASLQKAQGPGVCKLPKPPASRALCQAKRAPRAAFPSGCLAAQTKRWAEGIRVPAPLAGGGSTTARRILHLCPASSCQESLFLGSPSILPGEGTAQSLSQHLSVLWHGLGSPGPSCLRPASQVPDCPALPAELAQTLQSKAVPLEALLLLAHHPKLPPLTAFVPYATPYPP